MTVTTSCSHTANLQSNGKFTASELCLAASDLRFVASARVHGSCAATLRARVNRWHTPDWFANIFPLNHEPVNHLNRSNRLNH
jgi:hypothetical protein